MHSQTLLKKFLTDCQARRLSKKTIRRYQDDNQRLFRFAETRHKRHIQQIDKNLLRKFFAELHETIPKRQTIITETNGNKLSPFTTAGIFRSIKTFFRWCEREGYLKHNPINQLRPPKTPVRIVKRLSEHQIITLLNEIRKSKHPERNLAMILLLCDSGLRRDETISLKLQDIHLQDKFICVKGKGEKEREIPIGETTCYALTEWKNVRPATKSSNFFVSPTGKNLSAETIRSLLRRIRKRIQIERLYAHLLRHTFAKLYLKHGSVEKLSQILGHKKIKTTLDIYVQGFDIDELIRDHRKGAPVDRIYKHSHITRR